MKSPSRIHHAIISLIKAYSPLGLYSGEVRTLLAQSGFGPLQQSHLDRRMRELIQWWPVRKQRYGRIVRYSL